MHCQENMLAVGIIAVLALCLGASQAEIAVCPDGCSYSSIQSAIDAAMPGESITVHGPAFREGLFVGKQLALRGLVADGRRPVLASENGCEAILSAPGITLRGFDFMSAAQLTGEDKSRAKDCSILIVSSQGNWIYLNDFSGNQSICTNGSSSWNSSQPIIYQYNSQIFSRRLGNYWSDYEGSDMDGDGVGDQPKNIDANNEDFYPLMEPSERYAIAGDRFVSEKVIQASVNQPFTISMESNPTTGYSWTVDYEFDFVRLDNSSYQGGRPDAIGSGGQQVFVFTPMRAGKTVIAAVYKRPWENIVADERAIRIIISE